jgi:molybdate transport system substrate-binding protein
VEGDRGPVRAAVAAGLALVLAAPAFAGAAELTVLSARGVREVIAAVADDFQRAVGHTVWLAYPASEGLVAHATATPADVIVAALSDIAELEARGVVEPGTRVVLGRVSLGVAVPAGMPAPDVSTPTKLRRTVLVATSLAYVDPERDAIGRHVVDSLAAIGVAPLVRTKTTFVTEGARAVEAVGRGDVTLAIAPLTEIRAVGGVSYAGSLPAELQHTVVYAAAVHARSGTREVATELLKHLAGDSARARLTAGGLEPAP